MRFRLRTLMIVLLVLPPLLAVPVILYQKAAAMRRANHEKNLQIGAWMEENRAISRLGLPRP